MTAPKMLPTSDWLTAREIAELGLRDLPTTERGMQIAAEERGWNADPARCRNRRGRGGGLEYHVSLLPTLARMQFEQRTMTVGAVEPVRPVPSLPVPETERARRAQDARLAILTAWDRYGSGLNLREAGRAHAFASAYTMGHVRVDDWVRAEVPALSARTLFRWRGAARAGKAIGHDPGLARKGKGLLETAEGGRAKHFILAQIAHHPGVKAERVQTLLSDEFGGSLTDADGVVHPIPPIRTIQHQMKVWRVSEVVAITKLSDPDTYRSTMAPAGSGAYRHIDAPNTLWMIDASPLDALDKVASRLTIYACVDIGTRRMVLYLSQTPRAAAVALLIRKAILSWGVPGAIKTDNGSDFVAGDTKRLLSALGIEAITSDAYSPQQKGHVERAIRTMQHNFAELLPGYVGHDVAERKRLEDRRSFAARLGMDTAELFGVRYTLAEIQTLADRWIAAYYEQSPHTGLDGRTPAQAAREAGAIIRTVDERALDLLLMPLADGGGIRTVTKRGIQIAKIFYRTIAALPQDRVLVRMDPHDLGVVYLFDADSGAFVERAICPELAGIDPADYQRQVTAERAALVKERTDPIRAEVRKLTTGAPMIERYLAEKERRLKPAANVVALPKRTVEHETPAIAAAKSVSARKPGTPAPLSGRAAELHAELTREASAPAAPAPAANVRPLRTQETKQQRFRRALDIEQRLATGADVPAEDGVWLGGYRAGSEYRAMRALYEDGGERVLR